MTNSVFWNAMLYRLVDISHRFGATCCFYLQGWTLTHPVRQYSSNFQLQRGLKVMTVLVSHTFSHISDSHAYYITPARCCCEKMVLPASPTRLVLRTLTPTIPRAFLRDPFHLTTAFLRAAISQTQSSFFMHEGCLYCL